MVFVFTYSCKWPYLVFFVLSQANCREARRKLVGEGGHSESLGGFPGATIRAPRGLSVSRNLMSRTVQSPEV